MKVSTTQPDGTSAALYSPETHESKFIVVVYGYQEYP